MNKLKKFWKDNSSVLIKLIVTQLGMTFFALIVTMAAMGLYQSSGNSFILALASCFSVLFYLFLQFTHIKEHAMRDEIRINAGRMKRDPLTGLYISLLANSLNILLGIVTCISKLFITNIGYFSPYESGVEYLPSAAVSISASAQTIAQWLQAMYQGIIYMTAPGNPLWLLVIILPSLLVCFATYAVITSGKADSLLAVKKESKTKR